MTHIKSWAVLAITLAFAASPLVTAPFMGFREDQLPFPQVNPPAQPEGWAFAVWGLIYTWLIVSALFGAIKRSDDPAWDAARPPLMISLAIGTPWLAIANASAIWAFISIWVMMGTAIWALLRTPRVDRWLLRIPVALYAGWLTAASQVSLASLGAGYGILMSGYGWAFVAIIIALIIGIAVQWRKGGMPEYAATICWALVGIISANSGIYPLIVALAAVGIVLLAATAFLRQPAIS